MTFYRCTNCQYTTNDPGVPECPICYSNLAEESETSEDFLESGSSFFGQSERF